MATVQTRLPPRAGPAPGRILPRPACRASRFAARALVQVAWRRRVRGRSPPRDHGGGRARRVCCRHVVPAHGQYAGAAQLPGQGDDRARVARRPAAGVRGDHCAPGASRLPRPAFGAAQPGVRPRPHVHVAVLHLRVDPAPRRNSRALDVDPPGPRAARRVRAAHGAHVDVAARGRARRLGARRQVQPPGPSPVHHGHHRDARQRGARDRHRQASDDRAPRGLGALVRSGVGRPLGFGGVARAGLGGFRRRLCRRGRIRVSGPQITGGRRAAGAGRRLALVSLPRRHCRRDRFPPRHLDGRLPTPRLAGGLRRRAGRIGRPTCTLPPHAWYPLRARLVRLPRDRSPGAGRGESRAARRRCGCDRRRERRGQDHVGEASRQALRAELRPDPGRRH